jgi:hypothetical protein
MWTDEIATLRDIPDAQEEARYRIGIQAIDHHGFRVTLPALWVLLGPYSSGKSVLLRQVLFNLHDAYGWRCLLTAFEERIKPRYQRDFRRHIIGRPYWSVDNPWTEQEMREADDKIDSGFVFLRRARGTQMDLMRLLDRIEYAVKVYNVKVIAIDPVNEVDIRAERNELKTDVLGSFMRHLKDLGEDYGLLTILCAHTSPGKTERKIAAGELLTLYDGEDTRHWGGKSDIGWVMWRPKPDGPSLLHINRTKDYETMGKPTLVRMRLDRALGKFDVEAVGYNVAKEESADDC